MMMRSLKGLLAVAALSSCTDREFCDLAEPIPGFDPDIAAMVVERNRDTAVAIDAHNRTGERVCPEWKLRKE